MRRILSPAHPFSQPQSNTHNSSNTKSSTHSTPHQHQHQQQQQQAMPSNHGSSQNLHQLQQSVIGSSSSSAYNFQPHTGSINTSIVPRPTQGDRMTCIVNASITCISSGPSVASSRQDSFTAKRGLQESFYGISNGSSTSASGPSSKFRAGRREDTERDKGQDRLWLYVFGGFHQYTDAVNNDLYRLDVDTMAWEKLIYTKGEPPSKRNDHSASLWGDDRVVIFGGSDERNQYCNDVHVLHVRTLTWETPDVSGIIPTGRVKHAATIVDDKLYVSGGCLEQEAVSQELLCLNLITWEWEESIEFVPRYTHTLFIYRDKLFAYGGYNEEMDRTGVIAYMDMDSYQVTKINVSNDIAPNVAAQQFSQVCGHHLVVVISQGVRYELQKFTGGIWTLDLDCFQWIKHDDWKVLGEDCTWHYFSMERDGEQFHLIGDVHESDEYFKQLLTIDLREYGTFQEPPVTIGYELGRLLQDQMSLADFQILCTGVDAQATSLQGMAPFSGYYAPSDSSGDHDMMIDSHPMIMSRRIRSQRQTPSSSRAHSPQQDPILCHKLILMARWPHFANMVQSGMLEAQTNTLTVPESYETVKAFVDYLYTDTIEGMLTDTIADLLVMGSMYVMQRLVQLCSSVLHQQIDIETVARIYHSAGLSGQTGLRHRALKFMFRNYGPVSKTVGFRSLPKEALFDFWDSTPEGAVINIAV